MRIFCSCAPTKRRWTALRASLYMPALAAVRSDDHLRAAYHRLRSDGKHHDVAIVAIMHKLLRIIFGVLKHGVPYDAARDVENSTAHCPGHSPAEQKRFELKAKRRYQTLTRDAPITRKQHRTRDDYNKNIASTEGGTEGPMLSVENGIGGWIVDQ